MKDEIVTEILQEMMPLLNDEQLAVLKETVRAKLCKYDIHRKETALMCTDNNSQGYLQEFLCSFQQNGKSEGSIEQYRGHLGRMLSYLSKNVE